MVEELDVPHVLVMMATYNGEKYVSEQIESILAQTNVNITLLISDDGSTDRTIEICKHYTQNSNVQLQINKKNKGLALNFMNMVYHADSLKFDYFAFSDQDDYWLPNKLEKAINCIQDFPSDEAILYYSDIFNVDSNLKDPEPEYRCFKNIANQLKPLLTCNYASGCTMVFNAKLCRLLQERPINEFPRIHDVWVHLVAITCGRVLPDLDHSYIYRRITGENQVGKRNFGDFSIAVFVKLLKGLKKESKHELTRTAKLLYELYKNDMDEMSRVTVEHFIAYQGTWLGRLRLALDPEYKVATLSDTLLIKLRLLSGRC